VKRGNSRVMDLNQLPLIIAALLICFALLMILFASDLCRSLDILRHVFPLCQAQRGCDTQERPGRDAELAAQGDHNTCGHQARTRASQDIKRVVNIHEQLCSWFSSARWSRGFLARWWAWEKGCRLFPC
jgi:hypothetical protein